MHMEWRAAVTMATLGIRRPQNSGATSLVVAGKVVQAASARQGGAVECSLFVRVCACMWRQRQRPARLTVVDLHVAELDGELDADLCLLDAVEDGVDQSRNDSLVHLALAAHHSVGLTGEGEREGMQGQVERVSGVQREAVAEFQPEHPCGCESPVRPS